MFYHLINMMCHFIVSVSYPPNRLTPFPAACEIHAPSDRTYSFDIETSFKHQRVVDCILGVAQRFVQKRPQDTQPMIRLLFRD
jgi:hypothetical protein